MLLLQLVVFLPLSLETFNYLCLIKQFNTALHLATDRGNNEVVKLLLEDHRVDLNERSVVSETPLTQLTFLIGLLCSWEGQLYIMLLEGISQLIL
jgi:hypothetical protein